MFNLKLSQTVFISETVHLNDTHRSDTKVQADQLFNEYFYDKFTLQSNYDTPVNLEPGESLDIISVRVISSNYCFR